MIGDPVKRIEDPALLRGTAVFVDDIHLSGMLHAAFLRSPHPHAKILAIDTKAAKAVAGVCAVYTLADLSPHVLMDRLPLQFPTTAFRPDVTPWLLAGRGLPCRRADRAGCCRHALCRRGCRDTDRSGIRTAAVGGRMRSRFADNAPQVHSGRDDNVLVRFGQSYGDTDAAFADAAHIFGERFVQHRGAAHPIEGRGAVARYDALDDTTTLWSSTQMSHEVRSAIVQMFGIDEGRIRVVAPDVGGGFGSKYIAYPEEVAVALASRLLDRPVKWIEDRREHFTSAIQEREQDWTMEIAVDAEGRVLGVRGSMLSDQGAYTPQGINMAYNASTGVPGPYVVPNYEIDVHVMETNAVAAAPVRGAGYPEGNYTMERLLDRAAQGLGLDRAEIRRRNLIPAEKMPYETPLKTRAGSPVMADSGDFLKCQQIALDRIDYEDFQLDRLPRGRKAGISASVSPTV